MRERWWVEEGRLAALRGRADLDVAAWMQPAAGREVLSSDRQSAAVRWPGDPPLLVKWRVPRPSRRRRTFLRPSRERAEARALRRAAALGIPAPAPWAVGERRRRGVLVGSVLVRAFEADARPGDEALRAVPAALPALARALRDWHERGFRHGDCYPKNVLVGGTAGAPRPIGCPKARFVAPGPRLDAARLKDLAQLAAGTIALQPWGDPFAFLAAYLEAPGLPSYEDLGARVTPFYERILERKRERERTRPQREPHGPPAPVPLPADAAAAAVNPGPTQIVSFES